MSLFTRHASNPILTTEDMVPSDPRLVVQGVFNPAAAHDGDQFILLVRVAEGAREEENTVSVPVVEQGKLVFMTYDRSDPGIDLSDARYVRCHGRTLLSTLSHLRVATSEDGIRFQVREAPLLYPQEAYESYGIEDARVVRLEERWWIVYTAIGPDGFCTALASTEDFEHIRRHGIIFAPENKDVCLFPEKIAGAYHALHRPLNTLFDAHAVWYARSPDLIHWGGHQCVLRPRPNGWEDARVGGGAPCVRTDQGWLQIYHGANRSHGYALFAALFDLDNPGRLIARSSEPVFTPQAAYETRGFLGQVVFCNGLVLQDGVLYLYYGAADQVTALATVALESLLEKLNQKD